MAGERNKQKKSLESMPATAVTPAAERRSRRVQVGGTIRSIHPLGLRVVVQIRKESNMTEAGLYLPEGAKEARQESILGEVLAVASAIDQETKEEANISGIPEGALVLIPKTAGIAIPWDEELRIIETKDVLAVIGEAELN